MASRTAEGHLELAAALLGDHDRVEADAGHDAAVAATLADRVPDAAEQLRVVVGQPGRALDATRLLVGEHDQQHIARQPNPLALGAEEGFDHHRHPVLHVEGAPAPDPAVDKLAAEGRARPFLVDRRNNVDVALEDQSVARAAGQPGHEVRAFRCGSVGLPLNPRGREQLPDPLDAGPLRPGRVGRVEADQLLEQLGRSHFPRNLSARKSAAIEAACWIVPSAASSSASSRGSSRMTMSCS